MRFACIGTIFFVLGGERYYAHRLVTFQRIRERLNGLTGLRLEVMQPDVEAEAERVVAQLLSRHMPVARSIATGPNRVLG